mmetsp:Transcript_39598/g.112038  ORF Transcript_39598/g.112038 Transcript_39598/m.112038 type:complete len:242 (+) Transcript_39598:476-1201(+)
MRLRLAGAVHEPDLVRGLVCQKEALRVNRQDIEPPTPVGLVVLRRDDLEERRGEDEPDEQETLAVALVAHDRQRRVRVAPGLAPVGHGGERLGQGQGPPGLRGRALRDLARPPLDPRRARHDRVPPPSAVGVEGLRGGRRREVAAALLQLGLRGAARGRRERRDVDVPGERELREWDHIGGELQTHGRVLLRSQTGTNAEFIRTHVHHARKEELLAFFALCWNSAIALGRGRRRLQSPGTY